MIHDRFIGGELPAGVTEAHVDRYFRFMLKDSGVPWLKRWLRWAAVAMRTRYAAGGARRASVVVWALLAAFGICNLAGAVVDWDPGRIAFFGVVLPAGASVLWDRQIGAGLIAAFVVGPFLFFPMLISMALLSPFWLVDYLAGKLSGGPTEPIWEPAASRVDKNPPGVSG